MKTRDRLVALASFPLLLALTGCFPEVVAVEEDIGDIGDDGGPGGDPGGAGSGGDVGAEGGGEDDGGGPDDTGLSTGSDVGGPDDTGLGDSDGGGEEGGGDSGSSDGSTDTGSAEGGSSEGGGADGADPNTAPTCTITDPGSGSAYDFTETVTLAAEATDAEDGDLSGASVVWTSDLEGSALGQGSKLQPSFTVQGTHTITCTATDADGATGTDSVTLEIISPLVEITAPVHESDWDEGEKVTFEGWGEDLEDGTLTGSSLVWTSSEDGRIGEGTKFNTKKLSVATHTITLTGTDADGNTATDSIKIEIESGSD